MVAQSTMGETLSNCLNYEGLGILKMSDTCSSRAGTFAVILHVCSYTRVKEILEELSRTRFFAEFEIPALFSGAT